MVSLGSSARLKRSFWPGWRSWPRLTMSFQSALTQGRRAGRLPVQRCGLHARSPTSRGQMSTPSVFHFGSTTAPARIARVGSQSSTLVVAVTTRGPAFWASSRRPGRGFPFEKLSLPSPQRFVVAQNRKSIIAAFILVALLAFALTAVVAGEHDQGLLALARPVQGGDDPADGIVHVGDGGRVEERDGSPGFSLRRASASVRLPRAACGGR